MVQAVSHLGLGTVYSLWQGSGESDLLEQGSGLVSALRGLAAGHGGALVVEGCPTALKQQIDVWGEPREDFPLMRRIKEQLDPRGTLSPGRFLGRL
jgi:FAD/FMN-containing dehydrogenase